MDNNLLICNILRLKRKLKIKISKDIVGLEFFDALLLEVKSQKQSLSNSPNLVEIAAVFTAATSTVVATLTFYSLKNKDILTDGFSLGIYYFGLLVLFIVSWLLFRQVILLRKIKRLAVLEYYLEKYTDIKNGGRKKTNIYPNMKDSYEDYITKKFFI